MHRSLRLVRSLFATALVAGLVVPAAVDTPSAGAQGRAIDGLLALYDFDDGAGATVSDVAGADNPVDLTIADPGSVTWTDGGLRIDSPTVVASSGSTGSIASPIVSNRSFTVEVWVDRSDVPQSNGARIVDLSHSFSDVGIALVQRPYSSAPDRVELRTRTTDSNRRGLSGVRAPRRSFPADLVHLVATHAPDGSVRIYQDGVEVATDDSGVLSGWRLPTTLRLGASTDGRAPWLGEYRLLALYDRALSPAEVAGNFGAGPDLADVEPPNVTEPPADPPAITDGPEDVVLTEGDTANFVITATGTPPLTYQWFRDDTPLPDTNTPTLTLTNITLDDDGTFYRATVTGPGGTTTTDDARLGVNPAPAPNVAPVASGEASPTEGEAPLLVALDARASTDTDGTITTWSWDPGDTTGPLDGALVEHTYADPGSYTATITTTDDDGATDTDTVTITVTEPPADPPAITDGPEDVVLTEGDTANFVITATGTPPLTYQWFRDDTPLPDTNTPTLTLTNITLDDDGTFYRATVTGPGGTTTTDDARLGVNPADEPPVLEDWVLGTHDLRIPVVVDAGAVDRDDLAVVEVDLRAAADAAGVPGAVLRHDTLRVVEVDADGAVIDAAPPFQFDPSDGYEPTGAASGELLLVADGSAAGSSRLFHVYVDTLGTDLPPAVVAPVVVTGTGVDAGVAAISIETPSGTWWYDQAGGGFSSLLDLDGADWLTWSTASGSAGEFRGIPNLVFPEGHLHPGATSSTTTLLADGPLRASLVSTTDDGWSVRWDIAGARAVATVLAAPRAYWFLYEGTPGGTSDPTTDSVIRPGGLETQLGTSWTGDLPGDEWTAFRDGASDRSLLLTNRNPDDTDDSYRLMNGEMTVFGFGRRNTSSFLTGTDREFTVELVESGEDLAEVAAVALTTATATNGPAQLRNPGEPRPNVGPTAALVATPNLGGAPLAVDLDASASFDLDGLITTTSWDLGDGSTTTGSLASHTYAADGTYVVTVTVTDDDGATDSASTTVTVRSAPGGGGGSGGARVADGLVALYDLDDGAGAVVSDAVGGHDLTITQPGNVTWVAGGLRLDAPTMITNPSAPGSIIAPVTSSGELTLEAWIESSSLAQNGPARIVTLSNGARDRNITLGQGVYRSTGDRIDVRLRTGTTDANGRPSLSSATGSLTTDLTHVVFTRAANGTTGLYLDGVQVRSGTAGGDLLGWDPTYRLVLGNETDGNRAWLGTLHLVAFYDRALGAGEVETNHLAGPSGDNELPDQAPTADVAATTTSGPAPLDVVLDGTGSSDADGTIVSFTWDLGDGTTAASAVVDHGYAEPGSYDVTLTVVDDDGLRATDTITITATDPDGGGGGGGGTGGGGGAGLSGDVAWRAVSSSTGDLPVPPDQGDQTISVIFDIDGDGADDIVVGGRRGSTGPSMVWYGFDGTDWVRSTIEPELLRLEAGGTFGDIDGDGDLDLVAGEDLRGERLFWWENPAPDFDQPWTRREIKSSGGTQHHDQAIGDVDGDGRDELVFWNQRDARRLFLAEIPADPTTEPWSYTEIFQPATTGEGLDLIDVDLDGVLDIVAGGHWLRYVGGTTYAAEAVEPSRTNSQAAAGQFIEGGRPELIFDSGDFDGPLVMYAWDGTRWVATTLDADSRHGHSLDVADVDGDGHLDIMSGEMALNGVTDPELWVHYGDGAGNFRRQLVQQGAEVHDSGMGDFDGDGDPDIGGKPFRLGVPRLDVWWNDGVPPLPLDEWDRSVVDGSVPWRTIFVEHGDIDGDGLDDVVTGGWWWRNPGSVDGNWVRSTIGAPMNQMAVVADFDGDGDLDVLGTEAQGSRPNADLAWAENDGDGNFTVRTNVADAQGRFLQGAVAVELVPDQLQVALSWEDGTAGLQMLTVPAGAAIRTDTWAWRSAHPNVFGEALSVGDIDEDDQLDLFDGRAWFRNDGGDLTRFEVQTLPGEPDRNVLRDVDGDGDLDAIVTFGHDTDGKIRWFEQGDDPFAPWTEHEIDDVSPAEALSLDAEDVDGDGDVDVVIGEHANPDSGGLAVVVYEQTGSGWTRHVASVGDEHHDGTQLFDADGDGDLDVVSIGWTHRRLVLFENRAR